MFVKVRVSAGAKKEFFEQTSKDHFKIAAKEPALQNLANRRVIELVARHFKARKKEIRLVSGHRGPSKILSIPD